MRKAFRNEKGFTLIELAIVLVIIGIIIGAVLKGQDLIENARHKKLSTEVKQWETLTWTYYDRKGRFPGDSDKDGTIDDGAVKTDFDGANFINAPTTNKLTLGSASFYLFLGNAGDKQNIIAVCINEACGANVFKTEDLAYGESIDTSIDGESNGETGRLRATSSSLTGTSATWQATVTTPAYVNWTSATKALLYFFDKKP